MAEGPRETRADRVVPNEGLLLRAAGSLEPADARAAWLAFRERVPEGQESLVERRLLPLVFRNRLRLDLKAEPGLRLAYAESFAANARILSQAAPALRALREASIPTMVLKGTALLVAHYRDLGARPMSDVDILVAEDRMAEALDVIEGLGWRGDPARRWLASDSHAGNVVSPEGLVADLHRHATCEARFREADEGFFANAIPIEVAGAPTAAMSAGDQLLHTVIHGLRWSIAPSSIWVLDAITLLRGPNVDVARTAARAGDLRLSAAFQQGLGIVRDILGTDETLDALQQELRRRSTPGRSEAVEHWFRVREPAGLLGALPNLWFGYRRSALGGRVPLSGFPSFLGQAWRLEPGESPSRLVIAKVGRRLRAATPAFRWFRGASGGRRP